MSSFSKDERFALFLQRLQAAPPASNGQEAFDLICETLNGVEDELIDVPYEPGKYETDGRMYPPQQDNARDVPGRSGLIRYRSRGHNTYVWENGSIEIQEVGGRVVLRKPGVDGHIDWSDA